MSAFRQFRFFVESFDEGELDRVLNGQVKTYFNNLTVEHSDLLPSVRYFHAPSPDFEPLTLLYASIMLPRSSGLLADFYAHKRVDITPRSLFERPTPFAVITTQGHHIGKDGYEIMVNPSAIGEVLSLDSIRPAFATELPVRLDGGRHVVMIPLNKLSYA